MNCINLHSLTFALKLFVLTACDKKIYHITRVALQTKACQDNFIQIHTIKMGSFLFQLQNSKNLHSALNLLYHKKCSHEPSKHRIISSS